jgi:hypothetical protein
MSWFLIENLKINKNESVKHTFFHPKVEYSHDWSCNIHTRQNKILECTHFIIKSSVYLIGKFIWYGITQMISSICFQSCSKKVTLPQQAIQRSSMKAPCDLHHFCKLRYYQRILKWNVEWELLGYWNFAYEKALGMQCLCNLMKYIPTMLEYSNSTCSFIIEMPFYIL